MARMREKYMAELKRRGKESHVYKKYQLIGLEISQILADEKHKALILSSPKNKTPNADAHRQGYRRAGEYKE